MLRHIKLFEAFESSKLSKTLAYIPSKKGRDKFLGDLKDLCHKIHFPLSELSDEHFEYLPFNKALNLNPEKEQEMIKYFKFWFSKEGEYIMVTATNGRVSPEIPKSEIKNLKTGTQVTLLGRSHRGELQTTGTIWRDEDRKNVYFISDEEAFDGMGPHMGGWEKFGRYSWIIYYGPPREDNDKSVYSIFHSSGRGRLLADDPYWSNLTFSSFEDLSEGGLGSPVDKKTLVNANFGLVLDFEKLFNTNFKDTVDIKLQREESRRDATALMKPEEIKSQNLRRYLDEIAKNTKLTDISQAIIKFLGGNNIGFYIMGGFMIGETLRHFTELIYTFMDGGSDQTLAMITQRLKDAVSLNNDIGRVIRENILEIREKLTDQTDIKIVELLIESNKVIADKIKSFEVKNPSDLELINKRIKTIKNFFPREVENPIIHELITSIFQAYADTFSGENRTVDLRFATALTSAGKPKPGPFIRVLLFSSDFTKQDIIEKLTKFIYTVKNHRTLQ